MFLDLNYQKSEFIKNTSKISTSIFIKNSFKSLIKFLFRCLQTLCIPFVRKKKYTAEMINAIFK